MNILQLKKMKQAREKITMVTCYDYWSAQLIAQTPIDCILIGDSSAMVMHGHETTVPATLEMLVVHTQAVAKAKPPQLIVADMPFLSYRKDRGTTVMHAQQLMQAGAQAIKIEGVDGHEKEIAYLVESGVPVMGHLGLTPQAIHQLGGFKVQGRLPDAAEKILQQAKKLQEIGCFSMVLECVPDVIAQKITEQINIPTIGIGAGMHTDGQVLVLHDLLGLQTQFKPKFLKTYLQGASLVNKALSEFSEEVKQGKFPTEEHSYVL